nr:Kiwa anti-phage protein KwaB-like domain-containing protein [Salinisphaera sp. LB1]
MLSGRKVDNSWSAKKMIGGINTFFVDEELTLNEQPAFNISKYVDFFILDETIFVRSKGSFETVASYKNAHKQDFVDLIEENEFNEVFSDLTHIREYVGNNKMQLRRASAIRQKGHYKNAQFMENLRLNAQQYGLDIEFDEFNQIIPTAENCRDIFQALLDHRLASGFSHNIYDVPDASTVGRQR